MALSEKRYRIEKTEALLQFRTGYFSAERESVLPGGIYNKELASALSSLAVAGLIYAALAIEYKKSILPHAVFAVVFIGGYPLLRTFVFKDRYLEALFDRSRGLAGISVSGLIRKKTESLPFSALKDVLIESSKIGIDNADAFELVGKISAHHGTVTSGFGEEKTFFILKLILADGSGRIIYADTNMQDVIEAHEEIKGFLNI